MRSLFRIVLCVAIAGIIAGCSVLDINYFRQGVGTDIYSSDLANVTALNDAYIAFICRQAGLAREGETCDTPTLGPYWATFVQAGMNDIDRRCDAYLAWLDDRKRSQTPVLNELHALSAATIGVLNATGVGVNPITIVGLAFGLAADTFTNVQSRLVLDADHSTVQAVVLGNQSQYRAQVISKLVDNKPAAIYLLRGYLRICMPFSIETSMNNTLTVYHRSGPEALNAPPIFQLPAVIPTAKAFRVSIPTEPRAPLPGAGSKNPPVPQIGPVMNGANKIEKNIPQTEGMVIEKNLCITSPSTDFQSAREAIRQAKLGAAGTGSQLFSNFDNKIVNQGEAGIFFNFTSPSCVLDASKDGYQTAFEKFRFPNPKSIKDDLQSILAANPKCDPNVTQTGIFDKATRNAIGKVKALADPATKRGFLFPDTNTLDAKSYEWISGFCT